ncbi:MAG: hypothetical protein ACN0LA_07280 [Candidatus Longimicrobiales bacterium M2_2A_002]
MYTTTAPRVRDETAAYGPHEVDGDAFPAARVLHDLATASDESIARILARYATVRCWQLRAASAEPGLVRHAAGTARGYLAVTGRWREGRLLARMVDADPGPAAVRAAAAEAAAAGHPEGAYALLQTGYLAARRTGDLTAASRLAGTLADLLEARALDGAALWARRAERLRRRAARD